MEDFQKFVFFGIPLLASAWFFRELWAWVRLLPAPTPKAAPQVREPVTRADWHAALLIAGTFFLLGFWRLGLPTEQYFDEVHHVRTAMEFRDGLNPHEWTHPHISKLFMALGMTTLGEDFDPRDGIWKPGAQYSIKACFGWRFPSLVFGALALLAQYALARSLFGRRTIAIAATSLLALDGVFFVHARIAMTNIYVVCFMLAACLALWKWITTERGRWLALLGLMLGLGLATRWSSLWAWGFSGLMLLWHLGRVLYPRWQAAGRTGSGIARWVGQMAGAMLAIPLAVYLLSYVPFVLQPGNGSGEGTVSVTRQLLTSGEPEGFPPVWGDVWKRDTYARGHGWYKVINQQKDMWRYHAEIKEKHPYSSPWWSWPLMLRPVWYHFTTNAQGMSVGIWAIGNAVIWWAYLPVLACTTYLARREKSAALGLVCLFGWGMWLAWGIKPRPLVFMHYLFEAIPFLCIALAYIG